jgi:diguanylate cyclase (GGDEF)-like protein
VETVEESVNHLRKQNQKVVIHLQEEVQSLKSALESARQAATNDPVSGVLNRCAVLERIREELTARRKFSLVFIWVSNLDYLYRRYGGTFRDDVLSAFAARLRDAAGDSTMVGRWGEDRFVVLVSRPKPEAVWLADSFSRDLAGPYFVKNKTWSREITLQTRTGVIEAVPGASMDSVLKAADKLLVALESVNAPCL